MTRPTQPATLMTSPALRATTTFPTRPTPRRHAKLGGAAHIRTIRGAGYVIHEA